jgi:TatD DNase family protein
LKPFLNFHTHNSSANPDEKSIYNLMIKGIEVLPKLENNWISVGIHPWYIDIENWELDLSKIKKWIDNEQVMAIGECGLDRLAQVSIAQQLLVFEAQVKLAEQTQKPVIIHCVRAFNELIRWKIQNKPIVPLVVHGFNNKQEVAQQLLAHGFYFSLGTALMNPQSNASKVIKVTPIERLFLENDDRNALIETVYEAAANHLEITISELKNQIWANFATVFK